jgi:hypothetical protein
MRWPDAKAQHAIESSQDQCRQNSNQKFNRRNGQLGEFVECQQWNKARRGETGALSATQDGLIGCDPEAEIPFQHEYSPFLKMQ